MWTRPVLLRHTHTNGATNMGVFRSADSTHSIPCNKPCARVSLRKCNSSSSGHDTAAGIHLRIGATSIGPVQTGRFRIGRCDLHRIDRTRCWMVRTIDRRDMVGLHGIHRPLLDACMASIPSQRHCLRIPGAFCPGHRLGCLLRFVHYSMTIPR